MKSEFMSRRKVRNDIMKEAAGTFEKIGMTNTRLRNGVLIYFVVKHRKFAILGDKGIHEKIGDNLWNEIAKRMAEFFRENDFSGGLSYGIGRIGEVLKEHFPCQVNNENELPDDISFDS